MNLEKPLHVKVAEALGWTCIGQDEWNPHLWRGCVPWATGHATGTPTLDPPWPSCVGKWTLAGGYLPLFDTDWSAAGPLIEKYRLCINPEHPDWDYGWEAMMGHYHSKGTTENPAMPGATPLIAICNLILRLAEIGKLKAA